MSFNNRMGYKGAGKPEANADKPGDGTFKGHPAPEGERTRRGPASTAPDRSLSVLVQVGRSKEAGMPGGEGGIFVLTDVATPPPRPCL